LEGQVQEGKLILDVE
jgi:hypothetical protein